MIYQGNNDYLEFLAHYGVKGMKWGKHKRSQWNYDDQRARKYDASQRVYTNPVEAEKQRNRKRRKSNETLRERLDRKITGRAYLRTYGKESRMAKTRSEVSRAWKSTRPSTGFYDYNYNASPRTKQVYDKNDREKYFHRNLAQKAYNDYKTKSLAGIASSAVSNGKSKVYRLFKKLRKK